MIYSLSFPQSWLQQHWTRRSQESLFRIKALYKPTDAQVSYEEIQYGGIKKCDHSLSVRRFQSLSFEQAHFLKFKLHC